MVQYDPSVLAIPYHPSEVKYCFHYTFRSLTRQRIYNIHELAVTNAPRPSSEASLILLISLMLLFFHVSSHAVTLARSCFQEKWWNHFVRIVRVFNGVMHQGQVIGQNIISPSSKSICILHECVPLYVGLLSKQPSSKAVDMYVGIFSLKSGLFGLFIFTIDFLKYLQL